METPAYLESSWNWVIYEHDNLEFSQDMEVIVTPQNTYIVAVLETDIE